MAYLTLSLIVNVNIDIVRTESANDTPDVELSDEELLLTPSVVFGFSLNDKVWCTFVTTCFKYNFPRLIIDFFPPFSGV